MKTLLVAVRPEDRDQASAIADNEFRVYLASTVTEALSMLNGTGIDGVVCGAHFNEGNPFEFVRQARSSPHAASLPFMVIKAASREPHPESYDEMEIACAQEGIPFLDADDLVQQYGDKAGYARVRQRINEYLGERAVGDQSPENPD